MGQEQFRLCIPRSGGAPVRLRLMQQPVNALNSPDDDGDDDDRSVVPFGLGGLPGPIEAFRMNHEDYQTLIVPLFPRLEALRLRIGWDGDPFPQWFYDYLSPTPVPKLKKLSLQLRDTVLYPDPEVIDVLPILFGGNTPNLKDLQLHWFTRWPHNTFTSDKSMPLPAKSEQGLSHRVPWIPSAEPAVGRSRTPACRPKHFDA